MLQAILAFYWTQFEEIDQRMTNSPAVSRPRNASSQPAGSLRSRSIRRATMAGLATLVALTLAGCAGNQPADTPTRLYDDPYEADNRKTHSFNKALDTNVLRPVSVTYVKVVPHEFRYLLGNFGENLGTPLDVVNNLLQFRFGQAALNTARFVMNTTLGFGGTVDAATKFGIPWRDTDFGETLYVWGVPEGAYVELPVFGPSNQRDAVAKVVDFMNSPLSWFGYDVNADVYLVGLGARMSGIASARGENAETIDSVLYSSADSYSQARSIYLQNRRYQLARNAGRTGMGSSEGSGYDDPYGNSDEDPYLESYDDPYGETYDDPYAQ
ncbi:MlaA family lipoprotein [Pseudooceanicola algae]|uniref:Uncharacterized protein n=1 Tax=Pseudooceanicola algae TaxID=1537215 RepID=A0A418SGL1_9RHOB|nr:VacJ family lipoprotein [Pseudooceanicola algae]QPM91810.1 hypothetical protein PSAL_030650 [Pseudooceanicola algae]